MCVCFRKGAGARLSRAPGRVQSALQLTTRRRTSWPRPRAAISRSRHSPPMWFSSRVRTVFLCCLLCARAWKRRGAAFTQEGRSKMQSVIVVVSCRGQSKETNCVCEVGGETGSGARPFWVWPLGLLPRAAPPKHDARPQKWHTAVLFSSSNDAASLAGFLLLRTPISNPATGSISSSSSSIMSTRRGARLPLLLLSLLSVLSLLSLPRARAASTPLIITSSDAGRIRASAPVEVRTVTARLGRTKEQTRDDHTDEKRASAKTLLPHNHRSHAPLPPRPPNNSTPRTTLTMW